MPELPEAENIARALKRALLGKMITAVEVFSPKLRTPLQPLADADIKGHRITDVRRRGRYVVVALDDSRGVLMHFGMSGVVRVENPVEPPRRRHEHLFIHLDDGKALRFEDPRRFGLAEVHELNCKGFPAVLDALGPEPLSEDFSPDYLFHASRGRRTPSKVFLMDNGTVTGIGNIYATEALFQAGVRPDRPACQLTLQECAAFISAVQPILRRAIEAGGSTIADFRNVDGSEGKFARELLCYGKEGQPCPKCCTPFEILKLGGRTSAFCPKCQK